MADIVLVEHEVVHRDPAGHRQSVLLGPADDLHRIGAGDHGGVVAGTGQPDEADVALQRHGLRLAGDAHQAEPRGELTLVHHALGHEVGILHMLHQQGVEIPGIGQGAAHHLGVGDGAQPVRECDRPGLLEQAELGHFLAGQTLGDGGGGQDVDAGRVAGAAQDEIHDGRPRR